jgi:hypothetical protein
VPSVNRPTSPPLAQPRAPLVEERRPAPKVRSATSRRDPRTPATTQGPKVQSCGCPLVAISGPFRDASRPSKLFPYATRLPLPNFPGALRRGPMGKRGHWIWYVFPQLAGFGVSIQSRKYGIAGPCRRAGVTSDTDRRGTRRALTEDAEAFAPRRAHPPRVREPPRDPGQQPAFSELPLTHGPEHCHGGIGKFVFRDGLARVPFWLGDHGWRPTSD